MTCRGLMRRNLLRRFFRRVNKITFYKFFDGEEHGKGKADTDSMELSSHES